MQVTGHSVFATAIGACALAWGPRGIVAVQLPERDEAATLERMLRGRRVAPGAAQSLPSAEVLAAVDGIRALLAGVPRDLRDVVLDMAGVSPFHQRVYAIARAIPPGQTLTYGDVAEALGDKALSRAVGQALGANPFAPVVPCHRVLAAGGRSGGFSAGGGALTKLRMLEIEGAAIGGTPSLFGPGAASPVGASSGRNLSRF